MTSQISAHPAAAASTFEIGRMQRALVTLVGVGLTSLVIFALIRAAAGYAAPYRGAIDLAVIVHVVSVMPAIPLGAWLLLSAKGTAQHKALGKVWLVLMVATALSAVFIRQLGGGQFSLIHLFVPITLFSAWQAYATARAGNLVAHRKGLIRFYLLALTIPGLFAFSPGRLMWVWLLG
jgi:uncharacterized membrane protein